MFEKIKNMSKGQKIGTFVAGLLFGGVAAAATAFGSVMYNDRKKVGDENAAMQEDMAEDNEFVPETPEDID